MRYSRENFEERLPKIVVWAAAGAILVLIVGYLWISRDKGFLLTLEVGEVPTASEVRSLCEEVHKRKSMGMSADEDGFYEALSSFFSENETNGSSADLVSLGGRIHELWGCLPEGRFKRQVVNSFDNDRASWRKLYPGQQLGGREDLERHLNRPLASDRAHAPSSTLDSSFLRDIQVSQAGWLSLLAGLMLGILLAGAFMVLSKAKTSNTGLPSRLESGTWTRISNDINSIAATLREKTAQEGGGAQPPTQSWPQPVLKPEHINGIENAILGLLDFLRDHQSVPIKMFAKVEKEVETCQERVEELETKHSGLADLEQQVRRLNSLAEKQAREVRSAQASLADFQTSQEESTVPGGGVVELVELEKQVLESLWEQTANLAEKNSGQSDLLKVIRNENPKWEERIQKVVDIPRHLGKHSHLKRLASEITDPVKDLSLLLAKFKAIRKEIDSQRNDLEKPSNPSGEEGLGRQVFIYREFSFHLSRFLFTDEGKKRIGFELRPWIRRSFREFADEFFRALWSEDKDGVELEGLEGVVRDVLAWGVLEVIPTIPGRTYFDSDIHTSSSPASNPQFDNGVIVGVIRVGFRDTATQTILQRPEVVVNRR